MYFENIQQEIRSKYKKEKDQKIAEKCLQLGEEWTRIVSGDLSDFSRFKVPAGADPKKYKKELAKECKQYIKDNISHDDLGQPKGVIWIFILQLVIGSMISWIVQNLLNNLFEKEDDE